MDKETIPDGVQLHLIISSSAAVLCIIVALFYYIKTRDISYLFFALASSTILNSSMKIWKGVLRNHGES